MGLALLTGVALRTNAESLRRDLDADLELFGMAIYGLSWIDDEGRFHGELVAREPFLRDGPHDVWVIEPGPKPVVHLAPPEPAFAIESLSDLAAGVVAAPDAPLFRSGQDAAGRDYRLHATPSFDDQDVPRLAIFVVGDPEPGVASQRGFAFRMGAAALCLAVLGIGVGAVLARRSLRPLAEAYAARERFLGGAAHELRRPVASLRAICDSARAGDEPADVALRRLAPIVGDTTDIVEGLLLYARLDSEHPRVERTDLRLDLLVEASLPEGDAVDLHGEECTVEADATLLQVAVSNLVGNAFRHGTPANGEARVEVRVGLRGVAVLDAGSGFAPELLEHASEPFVSARSSPGVGLGLALVRLVAELHGGRLVLKNRPEGGALAAIELPGVRVSSM